MLHWALFQPDKQYQFSHDYIYGSCFYFCDRLPETSILHTIKEVTTGLNRTQNCKQPSSYISKALVDK